MHHHLVGELERLLLVVGDEHAGQAEPPVQVAQPAPQILPDLRIERAEWLVEQQDARLDRVARAHALALAAGELARIAAREAFQLHQPQQLRHPLAEPADGLARLGRAP